MFYKIVLSFNTLLLSKITLVVSLFYWSKDPTTFFNKRIEKKVVVT
jgi:hypothetical protein